MRLRLCSFNIENLFTRHDFGAFSEKRSETYLAPIARFYAPYRTGDLEDFAKFKTIVETAAIAQDDDKRQHTALAMIDADADVFCLQEVDNLNALERFLAAYYTKAGGDAMPNRVLHEGNDFRGIDVAALSIGKWPFYSRSHATLTGSKLKSSDATMALLDQYPDARELREDMNSQRIFRRDALELVLEQKGAQVTVFNCHFKSMGGRDAEASMAMRKLEAIAVRHLITEKFDDPANALWAVVGDLNDAQRYVKVGTANQGFSEEIKDGSPSGLSNGSGVDPLLADGFGVNLSEQRDPSDRWTAYYARKRSKSQLDYMASDHCPVVVDFEIPAAPTS